MQDHVVLATKRHGLTQPNIYLHLHVLNRQINILTLPAIPSAARPRLMLYYCKS